jgi:predicted RNase H-like HicB family nuclease
LGKSTGFGWLLFCGETIEEAKENVKEAIALYLEDLFEAGESAPQPSYLKAELVTV